MIHIFSRSRGLSENVTYECDHSYAYATRGNNGRRRLLITAALLGMALLLIYPCRALLADYYYNRAAGILNDPATEFRDVVDISAETMPAYREAIAALEKASSLMPSRSIYYKALAELHVQLGKWSETMMDMNEPLPGGAPSKAEAIEKARNCLMAAVSLEPLNPDYHLALGQLYDMTGDFVSSEREYKAAVLAAPHNAALRYSVAMRYLLMGEKEKALEHARALAVMDDSYLIPGTPRKQFMMERRTPEYLAILSGSYLYKSFEITWRASDKDVSMVNKTVPGNEDARDVLRLFVEWKGIDDARGKILPK
jgi:tetratricopeptide (TPR) repeat protein